MKQYIKSNKNIDDIKFEYRICYPSDPYGDFGVRTGYIEDIIQWDKYLYDIDEQHNSRVYVPTQELKNAMYGRVGMRIYVDDDLLVLF